MKETMNDPMTTDQNEKQAHASLNDLISIRDGETGDYDQHVVDCEFCQARLEDVYAAGKSLQDTMLFSADLPVPDSAWANIERELKAKQRAGSASHTADERPIEDSIDANAVLAASAFSKPSFWSSINTAIYSLAAAIVFTGLISLYTFQANHQARADTQALQASIQSLMDSSRGLESVLQQVAVQNVASALPVADQSAVERLQWRLMMVDQKIHESESSDDVSYEQIKALWAERIEALKELNKVYYSNEVAVSGGEI